MSTYLYLRCLNHTPPLTADGESGQHLYDLPTIWSHIRDRDTLIAEWHRRMHDNDTNVDDPPFEHHFGRNTARFLTAHPDCVVDVVDEYGGVHPVPDLSVTVDNTIDPRMPHVKPWTFGQVKQLAGQERPVVVTDQLGDWASPFGRVRIVDTATTGREGTYPDVWPAQVTLHLQVTSQGLLDKVRALFAATDQQATAGWRRGDGDDLEVFELWPQAAPAVQEVSR